MAKIKVIYNPHAGSKRGLFELPPPAGLIDLRKFFRQYHLDADFVATTPHNTALLAKNASKEGYQIVVAAGGDGTVSEVASGLIGSHLTLGILPLGSVMNIARMLSIPLDIEKAIMVLKLRRTTKIDAGKIVILNGKTLREPKYFFEAAGLGIEADWAYHFLHFEHEVFSSTWKLIKTFFNYYAKKLQLTLDKEAVSIRATMVNIANGPYAGTALNISPDAKLTDRRLTVTLYKMSKWQLVRLFLDTKFSGKIDRRKVSIYKVKSLSVTSKHKSLFQADARIFGTTPIKLKIVPQALEVISGFSHQS